MRFNGTELRSMTLAAGLLLLGTAARLGLGPGPDDFGWTTTAASHELPRGSLASTRRAVSDGIAADERAARPLGANERLDPNTAPLEELRRLPGIGPTRAAAILAERHSGGPFRELDDMVRVPGIGLKTLEALSSHLTFTGGTSNDRRAHVSRPSGDVSRPVNVNRADIKELEQITGIGPALSARIVATRQRLGPFRRLEDLLLVPGIGPVNLQNIQGQVRF
jgi:competence protein ComEA